MVSIPFEFVRGLALEFGCVECFWRESDRSFTGFVAGYGLSRCRVTSLFVDLRLWATRSRFGRGRMVWLGLRFLFLVWFRVVRCGSLR